MCVQYFNSRSKKKLQLLFTLVFYTVSVHNFKFNNALKQQTWQFHFSRQLCSLILLFSLQGYVK